MRNPCRHFTTRSDDVADDAGCFHDATISKEHQRNSVRDVCFTFKCQFTQLCRPMCFKSSKIAPSGPNANPRLRPASRGLMEVVSLLWRHLATTYRPPPARTPFVVRRRKAKCKGILRTSRKRRNPSEGGTFISSPPRASGATSPFSLFDAVRLS